VVARFTKWRYHLLNSAVGVFESAKLEFYRRCVVPYEEMKILVEGDIDSFVEYRRYTGPGRVRVS